MKRANETREHIAMKAGARKLFQANGWVVLFEMKCVDMTAFRPGNPVIWAVEFERSAKWVERNCRKAIGLRVDRLLIVARDERVAEKARAITEGMALPVGWVLITTTDELNANFIRGRMDL